MIVPANLADLSSMMATAMTVLDKTLPAQAKPV